MKKLFLYLSITAIAILVFLITFFVSRNYFKDNTKKMVFESTNELTTELTELTTGEIIDVIDYVYYNDNILNYVHSAVNQNFIRESDSKYSLGVKNGYVVVYENSSDSVFEYTDIDIDLLRELNFDIYEKIEELEFDTKEELFIFLESIES